MAVIDGGPGSQTLEGGDEDDVISGFSGNDDLFGNGGDDVLLGGGGFDDLTGGDGDDDLNGGGSFDNAFWTDRIQSFSFNLGSSSFAISEDGLETDTFSRIERIFATPHGDAFVTSDNYFSDEGGDFVAIRLNAGDDTIINNGLDLKLEYDVASAGVNVNFSTGIGQSIGANDEAGIGVDIFTGVPRVRGSQFDDILTGSNSGDAFEEFEGQGGDDVIDGGGGTNNHVRYSNSPGGVVVNLVTGEASDGFGGVDTISNIQNVRGSRFGDVIVGDDQENIIRPLGGDDIIDGGGEFDTLEYRVEATGALLFSLSASVTVTGDGIGEDGAVNIERFFGFDGDDVYTVDASFRNTLDNLDGGLKLFNAFMGRGGDDTVTGNGFTRIEYSQATGAIEADLAAGTVVGDASVGTDTVAGVNGIVGSAFDDVLRGGSDLDIGERFSFELFDGGAGDDDIDGRGGLDLLDFTDGSSQSGIDLDLTTGVVDDGFGGTDVFANIEGALTGEADDALRGDGEDNFFSPGGGADIVSGRGGVDTVVYFTQSAGVSVDLAAGEAIDGGGDTDSLTSIENAVGSVFDDELTGDDKDNFLSGRSGEDVIDGAAGDDTLEGGAGADDITGGDGEDLALYAFDTAGVVVDLAAGEATDGAGDVDVLTGIEGAIGSAFDDALSGDAGANQLFGLDGNDVLDGGAGADFLDGGLGDDRFVVDDAGDALADDGGEDTVEASIAFDLPGGIENLEFTADAGDVDGNGNSLDNRITGSNGANQIKSGGGADVLFGLDGDDILNGQSGDDELHGGDGLDFLTGKEGDDALFGGGENDQLRGEEGDDHMEGGGAKDRLIGKAGADELLGDEANDKLFGNSGDDVITGGVGKDVMTGGAGADLFVLAPGSQVDTIKDFTVGEDQIDVTGFALADFAALEALIRDKNGRAQINLDGSNDVVRLNGVLSADLSEDDFIGLG